MFETLREWFRRLKTLRFAWGREDGTAVTTCPKCRAKITLSSIEKGKDAFQCLSCGEKGSWL
jgi:transcription initiation factor IIE alpha subunit